MPRPASSKSSANLRVVPVGRNRAEHDKIIDRAAKAWEMRIAGLGPAAIGEQLGVSRFTVDADLRLMEARVPSVSAEKRKAWRQIQVERHEAVIAHHLPAATGGKVKITVGEGEQIEVEGYVGDLSVKAAGVVLSHMQAQAKVLRLDIEEFDEDVDPDAATPEERLAKVASFAEKLSNRKDGKS